MTVYRAELHVHTVLSPCAEVEMIPPLIVQEALERGINLLAITDHNASANVQSVQRAAQGTSLTVLPGMELQTREETHLLCIFDTLEQIADWQDFVEQRMPAYVNDVDYFGEQFVVDETGDFLGREERLLLVSADIGLEEAAEEVDRRGGLSIPAHVDRKANGLFPLLGFVPPGLKSPALEVSRHFQAELQVDFAGRMAGFPILRGGDVHRLGEFLGVNQFTLERPDVREIRLALGQTAGRSFELRSQ